MVTNGNRKNLVSLLLQVSIFGILIAYPFSTFFSNAFMFMACLVGFFASSKQEKIARIRNNRWTWISILYFALICFGGIYSSDSKYALRVIEGNLPIILFPLCLGTANIEQKLFRHLFLAIVGTTLLAAFYCLSSNILYFISQKLDFTLFFNWEYTNEHLTSFINFHPTYFSVLVLFSILLLIYQYKNHLAVRISIIIFLILFLILLASKIGIVLFILLLNIICLQAIMKSNQKRKLILLYLFFNIVAFFLLSNLHVTYWRFTMAIETLFDSINSFNTENIADYRLLHWNCAVEVINNHAGFGVGTGDSRNAMNECYSSINRHELLNYNAHNQFLEMWVKLGVPGVVATFLLLTVPYYESVRRKDQMFPLVFIMFIFVSMVESILEVQKGVVLFSFICCIYLGHLWGAHDKNQP